MNISSAIVNQVSEALLTENTLVIIVDVNLPMRGSID